MRGGGDVESVNNVSVEETSDAESSHSERMFITPSCIDSFILGIFEDNVKSEDNAYILENSYDEAVLRVYLEDDELSSSGWEGDFVALVGGIVNTYFSVVLTDIGTDSVVVDK